jgi:rhodanese-related sulfurtransferase
MPVENISAEDLRTILRERRGDAEIIDVRSREEYELVRVRGSRLIPMDELPGRMGEIDWDKEVVFLCRSGKRSQFIARMAAAAGAEVKNLTFGIYECFKDGKGEFLEGSQGGIERHF